MQRIAHVEDDSDIRDTVGRILSVAGYTVDSYETHSDFLKALQDATELPDLAILDVMVESMDAGLDTYEEMRKHFPGIRVIFLTSLGEMILPYFSGESHDWVCIVEKPVEPVSLLAIIRSRLDTVKAETSPA
ncbi:MAG: response regulator [Nitrosospira sp.]|jgi:two-component system response regulator ChvI|nr:response regulator [Nitrosospira sp.]